MRDIGKNIKELRQLKNLTQDELAEKLFVTRQTVSNYETGKSRPDIEMLTQIAAALDTDANTIIYGIPEPPERKRMILKLCISVAVLVVALIGFTHLANLARELAKYRYDQRLTLFCKLFGGISLAFLFGWTTMQTLGVFANLSPLKDPWSKRLRYIVIGTVSGYLLIILPIIFNFVLGFDLDIVPAFLSEAWYYTCMWIIGAIYGMYISPNVVLFGILGCALWLGFPQKTKE